MKSEYNLIHNEQTNKIVLLKWFWKNFVKSSFYLLIIALLFMTVEGSMMGLLSYSVKVLFDKVFVSGQAEDIWTVALVIFLIFSVRAISGFTQRAIVSFVGQRIVARLQSELVTHMLKLDSNFFYKNAPGLLIERVRGDSQKIIEMLSLVIMTVGRDGVALISLISVSIFIDWKWALIAFVGAPVLLVPVLVLQSWIRIIALKSRNVDADNTTRLDEIFHGINAIKLNEIENNEILKLTKILSLAKRIKFKMEVGVAGMPAIIDIVAAFGFFAVMIFGGSEILSGEKSVGEFMSFFTAMALIFEPLRRLSNVSGSAQVALASVDKLFNIFMQKPEIEDSSATVSLNVAEVELDIVFDRVSFAYGENSILSDISFRCKPGKFLAIVGASGSGKTTILNMIPRLFDPSHGTIFIGGLDIRRLKIKQLRNLISVVSQESGLFDDTIRANIVMGIKLQNDSELDQVLQDSFSDEFLRKLPQGLDTLVGPRGVNLSGGQRQRILIARALFRNKPILLLDEPTSALDSRSERLIQKALKRLSIGRTTIVVAHRISTIIDANRILVLNSGKLIEQGTHEELLKTGSYYPDLVKSQLYKRRD